MDRNEVAAGGHDPEVSNTGGPGGKPVRPDAPEISISEARDQFTELVERAYYLREQFVIVRRGRRLAALVPVPDHSSTP